MAKKKLRSAKNDPTDRSLVVVIHGFASSSFWMRPLCRQLRRAGHDVQNWGYPSLFSSIAEHRESLCQRLQNGFLDESCSERAVDQRIDFVAHSMGSVIVRSLLANTTLPNVGRCVLIAPPISGTPLARWVAPWIGWACRCLPEISTASDSLVRQLPTEPQCDTAVIAARWDAMVPRRNTRFTNHTQHAVVSGTHNSVLFSKRVAEMTSGFLKTGQLG